MKHMKKILPVLIGLFVMVCFSIPAYAMNQAVIIDSATATGTTVTVRGTTTALAVTVQLRDASGNIITMITAGTKDGAFEVNLSGLSLTAGASYTVYVADYEGGDWATASVTVPYSIAVTDDGNGTATTNISQALAGANITITASPRSGYVFKTWEVVSGSVALADRNSASTTFVMPSGDVRIKATFVREVTETPTQAPTEQVTQATEAPTEQVTETTEAPTENVTETTEAPTEKVTETTEAPTEQVTETTEAPTEQATETTEAPTEQATETTEAPTEKVTQATEAPTEQATTTTEKPANQANVDSVNDGFNTVLVVAIIVLVCLLVGLFVAVLMKKRKKNL